MSTRILKNNKLLLYFLTFFTINNLKQQQNKKTIHKLIYMRFSFFRLLKNFGKLIDEEIMLEALDEGTIVV